MQKFARLHWPLIIGLGALALIRPLLNISGLMQALGSPTGPIVVTILISLAWLAAVVRFKVPHPLLTLTCTGIAYGIFAIVLSALVSPLLTGQLMGPITNPIAIVSVLITNAIWGALVGLCAVALQVVTRPAQS